MHKDEPVYNVIVKKYPTLGLPATLAEFKKFFNTHKKFDKDSFLADFANTLINELGGRQEFLYHRTYPGDMSAFNTESNFLRATVGKERLFKLYIETRIIQFSILNALDGMKLGSNESVLIDALSNALKFLKEILMKDFMEFAKIIVDGWQSKLKGSKEIVPPSYIR